MIIPISLAAATENFIIPTFSLETGDYRFNWIFNLELSKS